MTNTGTAPVVGVTVDDADLGIDEADMEVESGSAGTLAAGQSVVFSYSGAAIDGDLVNTAEAEAFISLGGPGFTDTDTAQVVEVGPGVSIAKTVYRGHNSGAGCPGTDLIQVRSGGPLTYCFVVTNTGETNLSAVSITDADLGIEAGDIVIPLLTPTQTATRYVEVSADGDLVNTAEVVGTSPAGVQPTDDDTAEVDEIHPAITLDKTVYVGHDDGASCAGDESVAALAGMAVTWCFTVTNSGDVDLTDVSIDDLPILVDEADMTVTSGNLASIPPGGTVDLYLEATADGDLPNTATATGEVAIGPDVTDDDTAAIDVGAPSIALDKTVYGGHDGGEACAGGETYADEAGQPVTWCFT